MVGKPLFQQDFLKKYFLVWYKSPQRLISLPSWMAEYNTEIDLCPLQRKYDKIMEKEHHQQIPAASHHISRTDL